MVKANVSENRIVLVGKAWEIKSLLRKYAKQHKYVKDWIDSCTLIE